MKLEVAMARLFWWLKNKEAYMSSCVPPHHQDTDGEATEPAASAITPQTIADDIDYLQSSPFTRIVQTTTESSDSGQQT